MAADPVTGLALALRKTVSAMEMQLGREACEFHITHELATCEQACVGFTARAALIAYREAIAAPSTATRGATVAATCKPWCGTSYAGVATAWRRGPDDPLWFCKPECKDAGRPLNPATPEAAT